MAPNVAIEVRLMDAEGGVADWSPAHAGRGVEFDALRTMPASDLATLQAQAMQDLAWGEIPGGESVRFAAVFETLPDAATHFQLSAANIDAPAVAVPAADVAPGEAQTQLEAEGASTAEGA